MAGTLFTIPHFIVNLTSIILINLTVILVTLHKPKKWVKWHKILAILGVITALIADFTLSQVILGIPHGIVGIIFTMGIIISLIIGFVAVKKKNKDIRTLHIWIGRILYLLNIYLIISGLMYFL